MPNLKDCQSLSRAKDKLFTNKKAPHEEGLFSYSAGGNYIHIYQRFEATCAHTVHFSIKRF